MTPLIRKPRRTACAALALLTCVIPAVRSADLDSDGLSDVCQQPYGAEALEMNTDADHDGFSNFSESVAGTNPFIATDHLLAGPLEVAPGGDPVQLDFPSRSAKWYQVVESADLLSFAPLGPRLAGDGNPVSLTLSASQGSSRRAAIAHQLWAGVPANTLSALTCLPTFPDTPDGITSLTRFEAPQVLSDGFGARLRALITPPQTGSYVFSLSAAGAAELRLSPDGNPKNLFKFADILSAQTDISPSVWNQYENQQSSPIFLTAGSSYLLELRYLSSSPLGHCQAAWSGPGLTGTEIISSTALVPATFLQKGIPASPILSHDYDSADETALL